MTEAVELGAGEQTLVAERHYEAAPPVGLELVEPGETFATTKEEEWVSKKKTEVTNTKQIETRVKRQVVLEDGKVVEDSGPVVTTNTTEDSETQEHHQTELRKLGEDDDTDKDTKAVEGTKDTKESDKKDWIAVPNPDGIVREVKERRIISRQETEDTREIEDVQHLGDITDEDFLSAVQTGKSDLRQVLRSKEAGRTVVSTGPRLVNEAHKSNKVTDTEETRELSSVLPDGRIVTETQRTTEHEEVKDDELPEGEPDQNKHHENHQRFYKSRDQHEVDYIADGVKVGHEMRFRTENTEAEKRGDAIDEPDWDSLSARARRRQNVNVNRPHRLKENGVVPTTSPLDRKDALTKRPLDFDQEEETRKVETSKWLENHFGSESRSSRDSLDDLDDDIEFEKQNQTKTSFFNVTIKSQPAPKPPSPQEETQRYSPPEKDYSSRQVKYFQGISDWSQREYNSQPAIQTSPPPVQERFRISPPQEYRVTRTPPEKRRNERPQRIIRDEDTGYRIASRNEIIEPREEPPPDYSPTSPPRAATPSKKIHQKTRFAVDPPPAKVKTGNIIGQSIRKLVGKIRSASAERKAKQQQQRAKRSPSPSYKPGHVIDNLHQEPKNGMENGASRRGESPGPVQRYYLGEDPFGGSIYGRENKYDGVRPTRPSRKNDVRYVREPEEYRSQSTLGRFNKSSDFATEQRNSQTLPRHSARHEQPTRLEKSDRSNSTINVSIINTVSTPIPNGAPPKPARTYHSNLARSKSFNVDLESPYTRMHRSNVQLQSSSGLKSPGLISSISRSQRDLTVIPDEDSDFKSTSRFVKNGVSDNKRIFMKELRQRAPELYTTLHEDQKEESWKTPPVRSPYNGDMYETPTKLREQLPNSRAVNRRGSNSSNDYSETYHTTTRNDDPQRPTVTDTVKSFSKKTVPTRNGRGYQTIESTETKSVTKSRYRPGDPGKHYENERKLNGSATHGPVVIEVRNNYK